MHQDRLPQGQVLCPGVPVTVAALQGGLDTSLVAPVSFPGPASACLGVGSVTRGADTDPAELCLPKVEASKKVSARVFLCSYTPNYLLMTKS